MLDTCSDRAPPYKGLARITTHFLSFVGMVVFLNKDELLGGLLSLFAQASLLPYRLATRGAQVSFPRKTISLLISEVQRNSVLGLSSTLWS